MARKENYAKKRRTINDVLKDLENGNISRNAAKKEMATILNKSVDNSWLVKSILNDDGQDKDAPFSCCY